MVANAIVYRRLAGRFGASLLVGTVIACATSSSSSDAAQGAEVPDDGGGASEREPDGGGGASDVSPPDVIPANTYCESTVDALCAFYMRCGRMVAADVAECRKVFLETCNARYEPRYVALEDAQLLRLSRAGVAACEAHLATVACSRQISDLDGPCKDMWQGDRPAGSACGIDVESFVCGAGTACVLDPSLCGTCEAIAPRGGACAAGGARCGPEDACVDGTCVARASSGETCGEARPCRIGATCSDGTCKAAEIVGEGEACDARRRCAYRAFCDAGTCARASLLGEPCTSSRACASGRCEGGTCVPLREDGGACGAGSECRSGECRGGVCRPLPSPCFGVE